MGSPGTSPRGGYPPTLPPPRRRGEGGNPLPSPPGGGGEGGYPPKRVPSGVSGWGGTPHPPLDHLPCGAKKPTRHPLRRSSSASLFGAIANKPPYVLLATNTKIYSLENLYLSRTHSSHPLSINDLAAGAVVFSPRRVPRRVFAPQGLDDISGSADEGL